MRCRLKWSRHRRRGNTEPGVVSLNGWWTPWLEISPRWSVSTTDSNSPLRYFDAHGLPYDWPAFLDDFQRHWPTDEDIYVDFVRDGVRGNGASRQGNAKWRRLAEERTRGAKSVFHFDVQG
jgi:hypothetical protein